MKRQILVRSIALIALMVALVTLSTRLQAQSGMCGGVSISLPFTDVSASNGFFCAIAAAYFSGLTNGTSATTYSPSEAVSREQMAAFTTRTLDQSLRRGSRRAALGQWWTSQVPGANNPTSVAVVPELIASDGRNLYVSSGGPGGATLTGVSASDGQVILEIVTGGGVISYRGVLVAAGYIWATSALPNGSSGLLRYSANPTPVGNLDLPPGTVGITFDGRFIWVASFGTGPNTGSISRVDITNPFVPTPPYTTGFNQPIGILFDGASLWVSDPGDDSLKRVDPATGAVVQTIPVGDYPGHLTFDGTNLWVPCSNDSTVYVVRVKDSQGNPLPLPPASNAPFVLATLTGNGLNTPHTAAFDGERICVTNFAGDSVSLWKAANLMPIANVSTGTGSRPTGVCSDGIDFWIVLQGQSSIVRF